MNKIVIKMVSRKIGLQDCNRIASFIENKAQLCGVRFRMLNTRRALNCLTATDWCSTQAGSLPQLKASEF
jgi:hypothetical protein